LLDAALDRPEEALRWLSKAHDARPGDEEIAASYAHALVRVGRSDEARRVLASSMGATGRAEELVQRFIAENATARER
jgi:predicted Zn-dependent protease